MDARGLIIRNRRQELGWNMQRAADECGVDVGTISRLEAGKLPKASLDVWVQVCDGLGLDVNAVAKPAPVLQPV
jgi:transcriptional regulator with XRE-family HTH domain